MAIREGMVDVAVIGAGLAGLSAAITAARGGAGVTVLERSHQVGGRAVSHASQEFVFNLGPHALYPTSRRLLNELGVTVPGGVPPLKGYALAGGQLIPMPAGPLSLLESPLFTLRERRQIESTFGRIASVSPGSIDGVSLSSWLDRQDLEGRPRQFTESLIRLAAYIDAPEEFSAGAALTQMQEGGQGVIYPDGGWQTIVESLRATAVEAGAEILEGMPVRSVRPAPDGFEVSLADGTDIGARRVIAAVAPTVVGRVLPPDWTEGMLPGPATETRLAALDLGLARLPNPDGGFVLALDQPLYLSTHSLAARLAPNGAAAVSVARYIRPGEESRPAQFLAELEGFMDAVQPGWRGLEIARQYLPSITVTNSFPLASTGGLRGRPAVTALGIPGLYLAGDWVGDEGLLSAASLSSGMAAAQMALEGQERDTSGQPRPGWWRAEVA